MKYVILLLRWVVGLLFIFSGLVKTIDPIGFSIKLEEYFSPSVFNLPFLEALALPLSTFFVIFEIILGVLLILGIWRKFTLLSLIGLIVAFTFLTFYSAYFNKVTDCGCFGDAIALEPWESFAKDIILLILLIPLWFGRKYIKPIFAKPIGSYITVGALVISAFIAYQGIYHLPLKDFRPYAVGKSIIEGMKSAEELGLETTQIAMVYHLKNKLNGQKVRLNEDEYLGNKNYWSAGSPWEIIKTEDKIIKKGYEPPIHDFMIDCTDKGDMTYHYLNLPKLILIVTSDPIKASSDGLNKMSDLVKELKGEDIEILNISSNDVAISDVQNCLMDAVTLKTMIRANPGIILLKSGTVVGKYNWIDTPKKSEILKIMN